MQRTGFDFVFLTFFVGIFPLSANKPVVIFNFSHEISGFSTGNYED
jgi:hypothetical protein